MLELKNITKTYETNGTKTEALKGISIKFRPSEFVSILGPSGCGKTTLLNIVGGLDRYTKGDLIINNKSTKKFKDRDWDAYRNYKVGFVFQSYNLIGHQTVLANVELALTLAGINKSERRKRAIEALDKVGLKEQIHKKPNQLSGGQMQRVAIARALVNNPDIILADEPTGALDTKTSIQIMELLKEISKDKLIIMVTHNPELAEKYSSRIIKILDGTIMDDSRPIENEKNERHSTSNNIGKTKMGFFTAFRLSLNNLLTKLGRTTLVAFAGSIGIIGIALIQAVSNGFQNYVNHIQEDTLTSYPLTIMQESTDITSMLLSMTSKSGERNNSDVVEEKQYMSNMLSSISVNDLKSFKKYMEDNKDKIDKNIANIKYSYSVDPLIYTKDATGKIAKLNPNNLFTSMMGDSSMMSSYSAMTSIYTQIVDDKKTLDESYDILKGRWPTNYDEMVIVLSEPNAISDLLVYSLGLRDTKELTDMVTKIMSGEGTNIKNEPLKFTYDDLMKVKLKLIKPTDLYKYNKKYDIYEDMTDNTDYFNNVFNNSLELKIVGIVCPKDGVSTMALNPGVAYTSDLIKYIIEDASKKDIVKKQLENTGVNVISGKDFDSENKDVGIDFKDLISVDSNKLKDAFNIEIDSKEVEQKTKTYMQEISNSITTDTTKAESMFLDNLKVFSKGVFEKIEDKVSLQEVENIVDSYLLESSVQDKLKEMEKDYVIPKDTFKTTYKGLLNSLLQVYISAYCAVDPTLTTDVNNPVARVVPEIMDNVINEYINNVAIIKTSNTLAKAMTEASMKKQILSKVGELLNNVTSSFASSFRVDEAKIASAFKLKMTEEQITRIITAMVSNKDTNVKTNLILLGYQDIEEPTYISFYFTSFEGKENFLKFIDTYNEEAKKAGDEDREINYTDTTGILMGSVKTIVNAVTYVLIAFVSISLLVSSIMIGIITYISVYERTKEIGILRAIGASKRNISTIFNAETFIIGLLSGIFGIGISYLLVPIINYVLHHYTGNAVLKAVLEPQNAIFLIVLSVILTLIGGLIPAKSASKKDPVIALRTE